MKCDKVPQLYAELLTGNLGDKRASEVREHLASCDACRQEIGSLEQIWRKLDDMPELEPGPALRARFYAMLEAYSEGHARGKARVDFLAGMDSWLRRWWPERPVVQFAVGLLLMAVGIGVGSGFLHPGAERGDLVAVHKEVSSLRQLVTVSLLQNKSANERLRGVSYSYHIQEPDEGTLRALLNTLNYDASLNVRLAAVDALASYYSKPKVRAGLIESLPRQTSPLLQMALIDLLVEQRETAATETLRLLAAEEAVNTTVRERAAEATEELAKE